MEPGVYLDLPDLVRGLMADGLPVLAYPFDGYWLDIGRHDDYEQAVEEFEAMRAALLPSSLSSLPLPLTQNKKDYS